MNYEETVNFIKLFLLLMNGGTFILRTLIHKLILESGKSLDDLLKQSRELFEDKLKRNRKQFDLLFPGSSQHADIEQWDISLLTCVLLNMFKGLLDSKENDAIKVIRDHRNNILAHNAKSEMTLKDFMSAWYQVSDALTDLSRNTATPEDKRELKDIESSIFKDPFQKEIVGQLKEMGQTDTLVHAVIEKFMPLVKDKIEECEKKNQKEIDKCIERLVDIEKEQKKQGDQIALLAVMQVNTNNSRTRQQVQEHILEASENIIAAEGSEVDGSDDEVVSAVRNLFTGMETRGVKVVKADKGSILFTLLCPTSTSLGDITLYLKSPEIQQDISYIEKAVDKCHACEATITIDVDLKSLQSAVKKSEKGIDAGAVYLTLECSGETGVRNAFHMFENGDSSNTLNQLSEALSHTVGEKIELQTGIVIEKLQDNLEKEMSTIEDHENTEAVTKTEEKDKQDIERLREGEEKAKVEDIKFNHPGEELEIRNQLKEKEQKQRNTRELKDSVRHELGRQLDLEICDGSIKESQTHHMHDNRTVTKIEKQRLWGDVSDEKGEKMRKLEEELISQEHNRQVLGAQMDWEEMRRINDADEKRLSHQTQKLYRERMSQDENKLKFELFKKEKMQEQLGQCLDIKFQSLMTPTGMIEKEHKQAHRGIPKSKGQDRDRQMVKSVRESRERQIEERILLAKNEWKETSFEDAEMNKQLLQTFNDDTKGEEQPLLISSETKILADKHEGGMSKLEDKTGALNMKEDKDMMKWKLRAEQLGIDEEERTRFIDGIKRNTRELDEIQRWGDESKRKRKEELKSMIAKDEDKIKTPLAKERTITGEVIERNRRKGNRAVVAIQRFIDESNRIEELKMWRPKDKSKSKNQVIGGEKAGVPNEAAIGGAAGAVVGGTSSLFDAIRGLIRGTGRLFGATTRLIEEVFSGGKNEDSDIDSDSA